MATGSRCEGEPLHRLARQHQGVERVEVGILQACEVRLGEGRINMASPLASTPSRIAHTKACLGQPPIPVFISGVILTAYSCPASSSPRAMSCVDNSKACRRRSRGISARQA